MITSALSHILEHSELCEKEFMEFSIAIIEKFVSQLSLHWNSKICAQFLINMQMLIFLFIVFSTN